MAWREASVVGEVARASCSGGETESVRTVQASTLIEDDPAEEPGAPQPMLFTVRVRSAPDVQVLLPFLRATSLWTFPTGTRLWRERFTA